MRSTRTPVRPRRRPAVAGIRRPVRPVVAEPAVDERADDRLADLADEAVGGPADETASESTVESASESTEDAVSEPADDEPVSARRGWWMPVALLVAAAVLVAGGVWALARADAGQANTALVDTGATAEVTRQVREGLERIFSYRHDDTAATEDAARGVLTGAAGEQYERLFRQVREQAPAQRLTLATKVVSSGVVSLSGDHAVLLVFLDQSAVRGDNGEATTAGAQLSVTAVLRDGRWLISELVPR